MIEITRKPESISWAEISSVVHQAHAPNRMHGVDIRNAHLTGEEMRESIGTDGDCFVAIDKDLGGNRLLLSMLQIS